MYGFFYGIIIFLFWVMIVDVVDYLEWKNNWCVIVIIFSVMMVGFKIGLLIGSVLVIWILGVYDYILVKGVIDVSSIV